MIVNPQSAHGATGRRWQKLAPLVRERLGKVEIEQTRGPRDAARIAREAVRASIERLVVVGGDGTLGEVASGLLGADLGGYAEIGLLPMGTGGDFARTLGIPRDFEAALDVLSTGSPRRIDAGRVRFVDRSGAERTAHFVNVASIGVSGLVDEIVQGTTKRLGGSFAFAIGTVRALLRFRPERVAVRLDGELLLDAGVVLVAAANGRHFGGGMLIAPEALLDDGWLDVVAIEELPVHRLLAKLPKLYRGTHVDDPAVRVRRARRIDLEGRTGSLLLELDGEPLGTLPASIELLPGALAVVGPKA